MTSPRTALRANLERFEWLATVARAHHAVVDVVNAHAVTVPLRLATIYHSDERVAELIRRSYRHFDEALDRLVDRVEVGVKVYADPTPASPEVSVAASPGKEFLRRRRDQLRSREVAWSRAMDAARLVDAALAELAVDRRHHRPQPVQLSGVAGQNVLNAAYLVQTRLLGEFAARARALDARTADVRIEVTGPWAAYSFMVAESIMADAQESR